MAVNSKEALSISGARRPTEGDEVWAKPLRIRSEAFAIFKNPYSYGRDSILVYDVTHVPIRRFSTGEVGFEEKDAPCLLEITSVGNGDVRAKSVEPDSESSTIPRPKREESIEWEGTEQESGSAGAKERKRVRKEGDVRGNLNDLL